MSNVSTTVVNVPSAGRSTELPGDHGVEQVKSFLGGSISGLSGMQASEEVNGDTKTITFSPRTGSKG